MSILQDASRRSLGGRSYGIETMSHSSWVETRRSQALQPPWQEVITPKLLASNPLASFPPEVDFAQFEDPWPIHRCILAQGFHWRHWVAQVPARGSRVGWQRPPDVPFDHIICCHEKDWHIPTQGMDRGPAMCSNGNDWCYQSHVWCCCDA